MVTHIILESIIETEDIISHVEVEMSLEDEKETYILVGLFLFWIM